VLDGFQLSSSSTYPDSEHHPWPNQAFSCQSSYSRFMYFYLCPYSLSTQPVIPCMLIPSQSYLYVQQACNILVVHGLPPTISHWFLFRWKVKLDWMRNGDLRSLRSWGTGTKIISKSSLVRLFKKQFSRHGVLGSCQIVLRSIFLRNRKLLKCCSYGLCWLHGNVTIITCKCDYYYK